MNYLLLHCSSFPYALTCRIPWTTNLYHELINTHPWLDCPDNMFYTLWAYLISFYFSSLILILITVVWQSSKWIHLFSVPAETRTWDSKKLWLTNLSIVIGYTCHLSMSTFLIYRYKRCLCAHPNFLSYLLHLLNLLMSLTEMFWSARWVYTQPWSRRRPALFSLHDCF